MNAHENSECVKNVTRIGIDTSPIIYLVEKHPQYFPLMAEVLSRISNGNMIAISTMITLTEVLTHPIKQGNLQLANDYEKILLNSVGFRMMPVEAQIARRAAELRAQYNLKTPDALQIATALVAGCDAFLTNDIRLKQVKVISFLILDELEL